MGMDVSIYSVKANNQAGNISLLNENTKRPRPQDTQLGISKFLHFPGKFSSGLWVQERTPLGLIYVPENTSEKLVLKSIIPLKVDTSLQSGSRKGVAGAY